jgi:hypothetical protein
VTLIHLRRLVCTHRLRSCRMKSSMRSRTKVYTVLGNCGSTEAELHDTLEAHLEQEIFMLLTYTGHASQCRTTPAWRSTTALIQVYA